MATRAERTYPRFSDAEMERRHSAVRRQMEERGVDVLVAYGHRSAAAIVQYLTNFPVTWEGYVVFPRDGEPHLYVHFVNHTELAQQVSVTGQAEWVGPRAAPTLAQDLRRRGYARGTVAVAGPLPAWTFEGVRTALPDASVVPFDPVFGELFTVKSEEELALLRRAAELTDLAMEALEREARPGLTEWDLTRVVHDAFLPHGGTNLIHFMLTTPMSAPDMYAPAQIQSDRVLREGDVLLTEISVSYWNYPGQNLRPYAIGAEPTPEFQELYDIAERAFHAIEAALRVGGSPEDLMLASDLIEDAGYTVYDDLVHGFGNGYLPPVLRTRGSAAEPWPTDFRYPANSVWVIQPNVVTHDRRMGIQLGEMVCVRESGVERLHRYPMRFTVCGR